MITHFNQRATSHLEMMLLIEERIVILKNRFYKTSRPQIVSLWLHTQTLSGRGAEKVPRLCLESAPTGLDR